jgi:type II secretory pathway pseudopilin PulG
MGHGRILQQVRLYFARCAASIAAILFVASACCAQATPEVQEPAAAAIRELNAKYPGLWVEFGRLFEKLQKNVQFPAARGESRLLPLLPEATMSYGAIPNYGDAAHQAVKILQQELQESKVLREWWQHGEAATAGPKVEDALEKFHQISEYLGEEIVVSGAMEGKEPKLLMIAEVRKPGLKKFLQQMIDELGGNAKAGMRILEPQELASVKETSGKDELLLLVRADYVVGAEDVATLRRFNERLERGGRGFAATPFGQRVVQAYQGGVTILAAADVHKILEQVPPGPKQQQATFEQSGFADMKYLVWEHKELAGQAASEAELSFGAARHGAAAWLAKPAPLGSLEFVSPKAMLAGTVVLTSPAQIFDDLKDLTSISDPNAFASLAQMEQVLKLSLKEDLLSYLGGEITLEVDTLTPPKPEWKAILQVKDAERLQKTLSTLLGVAHLETGQYTVESGVAYHAVKIPTGQTILEIGYAFADGYLIIGSSRETVAEAVRLKRSGESLGKSKMFLAALPPGHAAGASALLYQDPVAMMALRLRQVSPEMAGSMAQMLGGSIPGVIGVYGEEKAIREASSSNGLDTGMILVVAAIAIPNLLRSRMAANESSAVGSVRTVNVAQVTYAATYPQKGYAPNLAKLGTDPRGPTAGTADHAGLINETLANDSCIEDAWCTKSGFHFRVTAVCKKKVCEEYVVVATPVDSNTGARSFCSTSDGVIRYKLGEPLTAPLSASECRAWLPLK